MTTEKKYRTQKERGFRAIALDAGAIQAVNSMQEILTDKLGFKPTLSQTVTYVINEHVKAMEVAK